MSQPKSIFFVEDDLSFGAVLKSYLEICNFTITWLSDGKYAVNSFREGSYDLCLLDVMLPNVDGFTIGREIRSMDARIPIIYLTAKSLKEDVLEGYKLGADDYIVKPFDADVLIYKIAVLLKRAEGDQGNSNHLYTIGKYTFDSRLREIRLGETKQLLSPKEAALLLLLCEHRNELLPREVALKRIWGDDGYFTTRSMDVFITKLRKFFKDDPSVEIRNIHGSGFIMTYNH
ncbi:MAG: response regulator transcription factor [Prolixibacteraceae bacterium]|jgi:DNA-binding response OmpR family regulator|nr:response regulator transcription factor [Prolixibacteraceae bacterium]